jgi:hypothetical protein
MAAQATFASLLSKFAAPQGSINPAAVPAPAADTSPTAAVAQNFTGSFAGGFAATLNKIHALEEEANGSGCPCIDDDYDCVDCCTDPYCTAGPCGDCSGGGGGGGGGGGTLNPIVYHGPSGGGGSGGSGSSGSSGSSSSSSACSGIAFWFSPSCWLTGAGNQLIRLILLILGLIMVAGAIYLYKGPGSDLTQLPVQVVKKGFRLAGSALKAAAQSGEDAA